MTASAIIAIIAIIDLASQARARRHNFRYGGGGGDWWTTATIPTVHHVDAPPLVMEPSTRQFLARGSSHPEGHDLIGLVATARIMGTTGPALHMKLMRGTCVLPPAIVTAEGYRFWRKSDVERAAALLAAKTAPTTTATP